MFRQWMSFQPLVQGQWTSIGEFLLEFGGAFAFFVAALIFCVYKLRQGQKHNQEHQN